MNESKQKEAGHGPLKPFYVHLKVSVGQYIYLLNVPNQMVVNYGLFTICVKVCIPVISCHFLWQIFMKVYTHFSLMVLHQIYADEFVCSFLPKMATVA